MAKKPVRAGKSSDAEDVVREKKVKKEVSYAKTDLKVGDRVVIGRHMMINGSDSWSSTMDRYLGHRATVTRIHQKNEVETGIVNVKLDIDKGRHYWRACSLNRYEPKSKNGKQINYICLEKTAKTNALVKVLGLKQEDELFEREGRVVLSFLDSTIGILKKAGFRVDDGEAIETNAVFYTLGRCADEDIEKHLFNVSVAEGMSTFSTFCVDAIKAAQKHGVKGLDRLKTTINDYRKVLVPLLRNQAELLADSQRSAPTVDKFQKDFTALLANRKIREIRPVGKNVLHVMTNTLFVINRDTNKEHVLGEMRYEIDFQSGHIKLFNETLTTGLAAPHVSESGDPCWGNIGMSILDLISAFDVVTLVNLLIQFCETPEHLGSHHNNWPLSDRSDEDQKNAIPVILVNRRGKLVVQRTEAMQRSVNNMNWSTPVKRITSNGKG